MLATLIRLLGDFDLAEEARQEAFTAAMEQWRTSDLPANPRAWLISAGRNKVTDRLRRDVVFRTKILDREFASAARALNLVDSLAARGEVSGYHLLHAARGHFLQRLGRDREALDAYHLALGFASLEPERRLLRARIASIEWLQAGT